MAFFSPTDRNELNPRFPSSIVVAVATNNLGFNYRACGKVVLPCGAMGLVDFSLAIEGDRKFVAEPIRGQHSDLDPEDKDALKGCTRRSYVAHPDDSYLALDQTQCGLTVGHVVERPLLFGMNGGELLAAVESMTRKPVDRRLPAHYTGNGNYDAYRSYVRVSDEDTDKRGKKRKGSKRGKYSARRNGLVKLERPIPPTGYSVEGNCDECGFRDKLTFIAETKDWLCDECIEWLAQELLKGAESGTVVIEDPGTDQQLVVTDQIDMDDVLESGGWGI